MRYVLVYNAAVLPKGMTLKSIAKGKKDNGIVFYDSSLDPNWTGIKNNIFIEDRGADKGDDKKPKLKFIDVSKNKKR